MRLCSIFSNGQVHSSTQRRRASRHILEGCVHSRCVRYANEGIKLRDEGRDLSGAADVAADGGAAGGGWHPSHLAVAQPEHQAAVPQASRLGAECCREAAFPMTAGEAPLAAELRQPLVAASYRREAAFLSTTQVGESAAAVLHLSHLGAVHRPKAVGRLAQQLA